MVFAIRHASSRPGAGHDWYRPEVPGQDWRDFVVYVVSVLCLLL